MQTCKKDDENESRKQQRQMISTVNMVCGGGGAIAVVFSGIPGAFLVCACVSPKFLSNW